MYFFVINLTRFLMLFEMRWCIMNPYGRKRLFVCLKGMEKDAETHLSDYYFEKGRFQYELKCKALA